MWWPERDDQQQGTRDSLDTADHHHHRRHHITRCQCQHTAKPDTHTHTHTHSFPLSVWGNQTRSALLLPNSVGPICSSCCSADTRARVPLFSHFSGSLYHFFTVAGCVSLLLLCWWCWSARGQLAVLLNLVMHVRFLVVAVVVVVESALVIESLMFFSSLRVGEVSSWSLVNFFYFILL